MVLDTLVHVYNRLLVNALLDLKQQCPALKAQLRVMHKAIDQSSDAYIRHASGCVPVATLADPEVDPIDVLSRKEVLAFEPLQGVRVELMVTPESLEALIGYVYVLATLAATFAAASQGPEGAQGSEALVQVVLRMLALAQDAQPLPAETMDAIMDDDLVRLLERVAEVSASASTSASTSASATTSTTSAAASGEEGAEGGSGGVEGLDDLMQHLKGSRIAGLASEISQEIDISKLSGEDTENMLNLENLSDSNTVLGRIVAQVGTKIQTKLAAGELKQDELFSEAMAMFSVLNKGGGGGGALGPLSALASNPMLQSLFKGGGGGGDAKLKPSARDRLRAKLAREEASRNKQ